MVKRPLVFDELATALRFDPEDLVKAPETVEKHERLAGVWTLAAILGANEEVAASYIDVHFKRAREIEQKQQTPENEEPKPRLP